ncbi:MAG: hypothetical protein U0228_37635 [Myxococcaceae bacterium]
MPKVLLIRPNDFIADAMVSLVVRLGLEALRIRTPAELAKADLAEVVGAVVSTAVTSTMPMSFPEAIASLRRRAQVPLVATTMLKDEKKALDFVLAELGNESGFVPFGTTARSPSVLGTPAGVLVLRKDEVEAPTPQLLEVLERHFHRGG